MVYAKEQVKEKCLEFFGGNELQATTCMNKYLLKTNQGEFLEESPVQLLDRVMGALASVDSRKDKSEVKKEFLLACANFKGVVPQGSVLFGAGNEQQPVSLSNCFVIPSPRDSIEGINDTACAEQQIMKRRGGVGIDLSSLRPSGAATNNSSLTSSGAVGWAEHFSNACRTVGISGRRGALMLSLDVKHPDALLFAQSKADLTKITGANISLKITDEFMKAVEKGKSFTQQFPVDSDKPVITKSVEAKDLWDAVCFNAWNVAEPGILFWDNIVSNLPAHCYEEFETVSTNPCGEVPLSEHDSCRLITVCLTKYVQDKFEKEAKFDFDLFKRDVITAVRMSDNLVELELRHVQVIIDATESLREKDLWQKIKKAGKQGRRTGLGTHGLADALAQLRIKYDSEEGLKMIDKIYKTFRNTAYRASIDLAKERGAFPVFNWEKEKECAFVKRLPEDLRIDLKKYGRRNIALLTMAPTGTISIMSGCSSGIEPVFRNHYTRRRKINHSDTQAKVDFVDAMGDKWQEFTVYHDNVKQYVDKYGTKDGKLPSFFVESDQIDWKRRVELQGTLQQYIDQSISSTINLPNDVSKETVSELYVESWKHGLKGVTVYRDGCRSGVLVTKDEPPKTTERPIEITTHGAPKRPECLPCDIHHITVNGSPWVVLIGLLKDKPYEVFAGTCADVTIPKKYKLGRICKEKRGKYNLYVPVDDEELKIDVLKVFNNEEYQALTRQISLNLRSGTQVAFIIEQLQKAGKSLYDFSSAVSRILKKYVTAEASNGLQCTNCGSRNTKAKHTDGCVTVVCSDCQFEDAKCG